MPKKRSLDIRVQLTIFHGVSQDLAPFIASRVRNSSHFLSAFNTAYYNNTALLFTADEQLFFKRFA
ncbi:hypothetical protein [Longitalea arenae]|uniref:hypothetical protein n=1 Tax=Longitalea arenae TaxID=2812558 RepID=UPI0019676FBE|nr:hypothetical protein [Longitalea arenae]